MISKQLKAEYLDFWTDNLSNVKFSDIALFCDEHNLSEDEIEELLQIPLFVEEDKI